MELGLGTHEGRFTQALGRMNHTFGFNAQLLMASKSMAVESTAMLLEATENILK